MEYSLDIEDTLDNKDNLLLEAIRAKAEISLTLFSVGTVAIEALLKEDATKEELVEYIQQMYNIVCVGAAMEEMSTVVVH